MKATDWLDAAVERAKKKYELQRAQEEKSAEAEALKRRLSNQFCRELFAWFESVEARFNNKFGGQVLVVSVAGSDGGRTVQILARPIRTKESTAHLRYKENAASVELSVSSGGGVEAAQIIKLVHSTEGVVFALIGARHYSPEQLGQKIIDDLLA
jgi:hypothetical protein